jgi:hypothetical protein
MKDYTFEVKKEKDQFKEFVEKPKKQKIKEASFMVNNVSSAQNAIMGSISIIGNIKKQPIVISSFVAEALISGIDEINYGDNEIMANKRKQMVVKGLLRNLMAYGKSLK